MKKWITPILILGVLLLIASVVISVVATANTAIIGGADWPTFMFHFGKNAYMALSGGVLIATALLLPKKS